MSKKIGLYIGGRRFDVDIEIEEIVSKIESILG